jgi:ketosteroid isomerase-like protein
MNENIEIVRRAIADFAATLEPSPLFAADGVWVMSTFRGWPDTAEFHGPDGLRDFFARWVKPYDDWSQEVESLIDAGEGKVVAVMRQRARPRGSDSDVELRYGAIYTVEGGRIPRIEIYASPGEAMEAVQIKE